MALGRISGEMLKANLEREGVDLAVETDLLYIDVTNNKIGVNTSTPEVDLHVSGNIKVDNLEATSNVLADSINSRIADVGDVQIVNNKITTNQTDFNLVLDPNGEGLVIITAESGGSQGIAVATPETEQVAWDKFVPEVSVTTAINDLNQCQLNVAKGTYVGALDFSASVLAGPSPLTVMFTPQYVGNATNFEWVFGDGSISTDEYPTKVYDNENGGLFTVSFKAWNTNGTFSGDGNQGAVGSWDDETKTEYITLYTPLPIPAFTLADYSIDSGSTVLATNASQYSTSYSMAWGDGSTEPLANGWTTTSHTYTNVGGDAQYFGVLSGTNATSGPTGNTVDSAPVTVDVYSTHVPTFTTDVIRVVNEEATGGGIVTFTNNTLTSPGETATFTSNRYQWTYGDGIIDTVDVASGIAGNPGTPIQHTYSLTASEQSSGITVTRQSSLAVVNGHSLSPFVSVPVVIYVEPDVRANIDGTAVTVSDRIGDNQYSIYNFVDYNGNNRALVRATNTSQNADSYIYSWGDGSIDDAVNEDGISSGSTGAPLNHDYTLAPLGTRILNFYAEGTPDTIAQNDTETLSFVYSQPPAPPADLSSFNLQFNTLHEGINPKLAFGFTDNSSTSPLVAGSSLETNNARRFVSNVAITTDTVNNAYDGTTGTLTSVINGTASGNITFTTALNQTGNFGSLIVTEQGDAHDTVSPSIYPTGFYQTFDANISSFLTNYPVGVSDQRLEHTTTGETNYVSLVRDDLVLIPTLNTSSASVTEAGATYTYVSGVPYYNAGSNLTVNNISVTNWIGQAYRDTAIPFYVANHTNYEGTTGNVIAQQNKSYADIDGVTTFLTGGIPNANTGKTVPYILGDIPFVVNGDVTDAAATLGVRLYNVNGVSAFTEVPVKVQVYRENAGFDETLIPVSDGLGLVYDDDGKRILMSGADRPAYTATDFYTNAEWSGAVPVEGTNEAIVRWGVLEHNTMDLSTGYMPQGPDLLTGRAGAQYFTFAFRRTNVANFDIRFTGRLSGMWMAAPGTQIDVSANSTNGWVNCSEVYGGSGLPGTNLAFGGNGIDGCAVTTIDKIPLGSYVDNGSFSLTLGNENMSNATGNNVLIRIRLESGDYIESISIGEAS